MYIILSQKIDTSSDYNDEPYAVYHFPAKYRKQITEGDQFIYHQGDRRRPNLRYYFGMGRIGKVYNTGPDDWYAELVDCFKFEKKVPIHIPGGYIEQLDYQLIRKSKNPPWQWSIRPLSGRAFQHIIGNAGNLIRVSHDGGNEGT